MDEKQKNNKFNKNFNSKDYFIVERDEYYFHSRDIDIDSIKKARGLDFFIIYDHTKSETK